MHTHSGILCSSKQKLHHDFTGIRVQTCAALFTSQDVELAKMFNSRMDREVRYGGGDGARLVERALV